MNISFEVRQVIREFADKRAQQFLDGISPYVNSSSSQRIILAALADAIEESYLRLVEVLIPESARKAA